MNLTSDQKRSLVVWCILTLVGQVALYVVIRAFQ